MEDEEEECFRDPREIWADLDDPSSEEGDGPEECPIGVQPAQPVRSFPPPSQRWPSRRWTMAPRRSAREAARRDALSARSCPMAAPSRGVPIDTPCPRGFGSRQRSPLQSPGRSGAPCPGSQGGPQQQIWQSMEQSRGSFPGFQGGPQQQIWQPVQSGSSCSGSQGSSMDENLVSLGHVVNRPSTSPCPQARQPSPCQRMPGDPSPVRIDFANPQGVPMQAMQGFANRSTPTTQHCHQAAPPMQQCPSYRVFRDCNRKLVAEGPCGTQELHPKGGPFTQEQIDLICSLADIYCKDSNQANRHDCSGSEVIRQIKHLVDQVIAKCQK